MKLRDNQVVLKDMILPQPLPRFALSGLSQSSS